MESAMERYRSGHNEAVLKTVCPQGRMGSNPILSARQKKVEKIFKKVVDNRKDTWYHIRVVIERKLNDKNK